MQRHIVNPIGWQLAPVHLAGDCKDHAVLVPERSFDAICIERPTANAPCIEVLSRKLRVPERTPSTMV